MKLESFFTSAGFMFHQILGKIMLKHFTVSLDAQDSETLCALVQEQRPSVPLQYTVRLAMRRFLDKYENRVITLASTKRSKG